VQDDGIGISVEDQDKLFKLFGFLDNTKELNSKGVGLGLHISQKITMEFGGKIIVKSKKGQGANFVYLFDLCEKKSEKLELIRHMNPTKKTYQKIIISKSVENK
jgi:signal transduction histidine kinase